MPVAANARDKEKRNNPADGEISAAATTDGAISAFAPTITIIRQRAAVLLFVRESGAVTSGFCLRHGFFNVKNKNKKHTEAFMFALPEARDSLGAVGSSHQWPVTPAQDPSNWDLRGARVELQVIGPSRMPGVRCSRHI